VKIVPGRALTVVVPVFFASLQSGGTARARPSSITDRLLHCQPWRAALGGVDPTPARKFSNCDQIPPSLPCVVLAFEVLKEEISALAFLLPLLAETLSFREPVALREFYSPLSSPFVFFSPAESMLSLAPFFLSPSVLVPVLVLCRDQSHVGAGSTILPPFISFFGLEWQHPELPSVVLSSALLPFFLCTSSQGSFDFSLLLLDSLAAADLELLPPLVFISSAPPPFFCAFNRGSELTKPTSALSLPLVESIRSFPHCAPQESSHSLLSLFDGWIFFAFSCACATP